MSCYGSGDVVHKTETTRVPSDEKKKLAVLSIVYSSSLCKRKTENTLLTVQWKLT